MKIIIENYPNDFSFEVTEKLPKFKFLCPVRTRIVQQQIEEQKIDIPYHDVSDYGVESIIPFEGGEVWELGT